MLGQNTCVCNLRDTWLGNPHPAGPTHAAPSFGYITEKAFYKDFPEFDDPRAPEPTLAYHEKMVEDLTMVGLTWETAGSQQSPNKAPLCTMHEHMDKHARLQHTTMQCPQG